MEEVYRNHIQKGQGGSGGQGVQHVGIKERVMRSGDRDLDGYTRDAQNEIQATFPRLPNPTLVMYVYPHLSTSSQLPVPGYSTAFPLYERPQYALPGEM
jgi:conjugative transfer region lipoprotein (TIGR03751 family)